MIDESTLQGLHGLGGLEVVAHVDAAVVVGRVHEDLVDAACFGHHVHWAEVMHRKWLLAIEGGKQVGDDPELPGAALINLLERWQGGFLVAGAERARPTWIGFNLGAARRKISRSLGAVGHDCDPTAGERIQTHLRHL